MPCSCSSDGFAHLLFNRVLFYRTLTVSDALHLVNIYSLDSLQVVMILNCSLAIILLAFSCWLNEEQMYL